MRVDYGIGSEHLVLGLLEALAREVTEIRINIAPALLRLGRLVMAQHAAASK